MARAVGRLANTTNVIHGFICFVPEAREEYEKLGLDTFPGVGLSSRGPIDGTISE